jgi:hypothetical protein
MGLLLSGVILSAPVSAVALGGSTTTLVDKPDVFVTELQTSGVNGASEEFIELYNATDQDIDFADSTQSGQDTWKIQFYSSTATTNGTPDWTKPSTSVALTGMIGAHEYYLLSATGYLPNDVAADQNYSSRLADSGGGVQLVDVTDAVTTAHDRLIWKQPASGQSLPSGVVAAHGSGMSLQRIPNDDSEYIEADGALTNIEASAPISPKTAWVAPSPVPSTDGAPDNGDTQPGQGEGQTVDGTPDATDQPAADNTGLQTPQITELLPNPTAPQTDDADEYIELYNPNDVPFNLRGYSLETGTTTLHDFTFTNDVIIPANAYVAFYSRETHLTLSNSGGRARLLDASNQTVNEAATYGSAAEGKAWALIDGAWLWTAPTPGTTNVAPLPVVLPVAKSTAKKSITKKASTVKKASASKKASSKKVSGKTSTKKAKKIKKATTSGLASIAAVTPDTPIHTSALVGVGSLALLYGAYEYRHDMANRYYRIRADRAARRATRQKS